MPQLRLIFILVQVPLNMLSGRNTPFESIPRWLAAIMQVSPTVHFVSFARGDPLSRRRFRGGLTAIRDRRTDRWAVPRARIARFRKVTAAAM